MAKNKEVEAVETVEAVEAKAQEADILAQVDAKIAEMLAAAESKAQEIIAAAEAKAKGNAGTTEKFNTEHEKSMEEYVTVKLFKDNGKYSDDVFVAVNGEGCNIPRGIPVKIKKKFAEVLERSDMQDFETTKFMDAEAAKFEEESKKLNI